MSEVYVSVDVETDGPIPGPYSMLSFGAAAFDSQGRLETTFTRNLGLLEGATQHPDTMAWWRTQGDAYAKTRENVVSPAIGTRDFVEWASNLGAAPVFVAYPAGFDFTFMYWYMIRFVGRSPFSFSALDIKSYAMAKLGTEYRKTTKKQMPKAWFSKAPHTHVALDDAIEQGQLFVNALRSTPRGYRL